MIKDFDEEYGRIHAEIQENSGLVRLLFESARENLPDAVNRIGYKNSYFPTGLMHNGIYLGVDLKAGHKGGFSDIIANKRFGYD